MRRIQRLAACAMVFAACALASSMAAAAPPTIFAAASLEPALDQMAHDGALGSPAPRLVYAASSALARQIESGAPADIFISADLAWMDDVEQHHLVVPGTRVTLLRNSLVLVAPAASTTALKIVPGFDLAAALGSDRLAMANPDSVPAGKYGKSALEALGVWPSIEKKVARADNVRAALALVSRGEAPYGIVYSTDALADKGVRIVGTFPANTHPPIVYPAALLIASHAPAAKSLLDYLKTPAAGTIWEKYGFGLAR